MPRFQELWIIGPIVCVTLGIRYCYKNLNIFMTVRSFIGKPIVLPAFLANHKEMLDNCGAREAGTVWVLANFLSDGAKEV